MKAKWFNKKQPLLKIALIAKEIISMQILNKSGIDFPL